MSKLLLISTDQKVTIYLENISDSLSSELVIFNENREPLDVISNIFSIHPSILILDDDFLTPSTARLLESVKKVNSKLPIIILTSDNNLEFGRAINNIGVKYYLIKPIIEGNLREYIQSIYHENEKNIY
jgi:DNA-binding NarL/FixJ family response regulator